MTKATKYLLDTNVLVEASKRYYAFDLVSTFWEQLTNQAQAGIISSIDKVKAEIHYKNSSLTDWANNRFKRWESTDVVGTVEKHQDLMKWSISHQQYTTKAKAEFASDSKADAWLVAHALARQCVIVTEEVFNRDIKRKIPIPNVCQEFDVTYVDTFQMLRDLKINLVYSRTR